MLLLYRGKPRKEIRLRLKREDRIKFIKDIAKEIFLSKGFESTTMEDIIKASNMSIGGVYYYFKNKFEIIHDIMIDGIKFRHQVIDDTGYDKSDEVLFVSRFIADRIVDENEFMALFIQFLQIKNHDDRLKALYDELFQINRENLINFVGESSKLRYLFDDKFFVSFCNALLMGANLVGPHEDYLKNKSFIQDSLVLYIRKYYGG